MNIIKTNFNFIGKSSQRLKTDYIILHHRAGTGDVKSIHKQHQAQGYSGIGYQFYITKDGMIYEGRDLNAVGAHCLGYNINSIGICFEGNFEIEKATEKQIESGRNLIKHLKNIYPNAEVKQHKDLYATVCPGKNFPFSEIIKMTDTNELTSVNDIVWELENKGIITNKKLWLKKLKEDENSYWLARKCINYIVNQK